MRDKEKGWVEIELKGEGDEKHVIRRDMERASNWCAIMQWMACYDRLSLERA